MYLNSERLFEALRAARGQGALMVRNRKGTFRIETGIERNVISGLSKLAARHYWHELPRISGVNPSEARHRCNKKCADRDDLLVRDLAQAPA